MNYPKQVKTMKITAALVLLALSGNAYAKELRFGVSAGQGEISLSNKFSAHESYVGDSALSGSIYLGYIFEDKYIVDLVYSSTGDDLFIGFVDSVHIDSYGLQLGYRFNFDHLYLEPRIGLSTWELKFEEGFLLNPGPEEVSKADGTDLTYSVTAGYKLSDSFGLSLSYKYFEFEQGKSTSAMFGAYFEF